MSLGPNFIKSYEVKVSKSGHQVPVVNGVHLHSVYDPIKEAETLISKNIKSKEQKYFLILGLGYGYHVQALRKLINDPNSEAQIVVIEPNANVAHDCIENGLIGVDDVYLSINQAPRDIYSNNELTRFLLKKPQVISHPSSFNLYHEYFKELLSYEAPTQIGEMLHTVTSPTLKEYLSSHAGKTFAELTSSLNRPKPLRDEVDLLVLGLNEMTQKSETLTHGS